MSQGAGDSSGPPEATRVEQSQQSSMIDPNCRPTKKKILDLVVPHVSPKWYELGVKLLKEEQESQLDVIQSNNNDNKTCCREMFWYWLRSNPNASWYQLVECLRSPAVELHALAADIEKLYAEPIQSTVQPTVGTDNQARINDERKATSPNASQHVEKSREQRSKENQILPNFTAFENISTAFVRLISGINAQLAESKFFDLRRACLAQIKTPRGAKLSPTAIEKIKCTKTLDDLLDLLVDTPYCSWIDLRLLEALVAASGSSTAEELLSSYKKAIFSKKLYDVLPSTPSKKVKEEFYSRIVSKVDKKADEITVADLLDLQSDLEVVIMEIGKGTCTLDHFTDGCIEIHWHIPNHCAEHAYHSACVKRHKFHELSLQSLQIGDFPMIYDPLTAHLSWPIVSEPQPPISAESSKDIIDHFYHYMSHALDSDLIVHQMSTQKLLSEDEVHNVKIATSKYYKNCLVLEKVRLMNITSLTSFCNFLIHIDHQKHVGTTLLKALQSFNMINPHQGLQIEDDHDASSQSDKDAFIPSQSATSRKRQLSSDQPEPSKHFKPSTVITEFLDMKCQLQHVLQSYDAKVVFEKCEKLMASETDGVLLFSSDHLQKLKDCSLVPALLQKLSPYFNWSDHSVLSMAISACDNPVATKLLDQFDSKVDKSLPVTDYPIPQPSPNMVPYDNSTHTVLAVKLNTDLSTFSLQNILDLRYLLQENFQVTLHVFQLLAAKRSSTFLYWTIPKCIVSIITARISQRRSYLYQNDIVELSVYPGSVFITTSSLKVGSLSFFTQIDFLSHDIDRNVLCSQLSHLEELPKVMAKLHTDVVEMEKTAVGEKSLVVQDATVSRVLDSDQDAPSSIDQGSTLYSDDTEMLKHISRLNTHKKQLLAERQQHKADEVSLQEQLNRTREEYSSLLQEHEGLKHLLKGDEVKLQFSNSQRKLEKIQTSCEKMVRICLSDKLIKDAESEESETRRSLQPKDSFLAQLRGLDTEINIITGWMEHLQVLPIEMAEKNEKLDELTSLTTTLKKENLEFKVKHEVTSEEVNELSSQLKINKSEIAKLKEENKLLVKQFREIKDTKLEQRRFPQEQLIQQEVLGYGQYGSVCKLSDHKKFYAGKTILKRFVPGYPDISNDRLVQYVEKFKVNSVKFISFSHSNIEIFEAVLQLTPDSPPTLVSELLPVNLDTFTVRVKGKCPIHKQLELCHDMASGLRYLHSVNVVHCNLHGRNILISGSGKAKISDYICPQVISTGNTAAPINVAYLPPEVINDRSHYTALSDIYSLGVLFLQVVTQKLPDLTDKTENAKMNKRLEELTVVKGHLLWSTILQCLNTMRITRPPIDKICQAVAAAKEAPQNVMSTTFHNIDSPEFSLALQSGRYQLNWTTCSPLPTAMRIAYATVIKSVMYIGGGACPDRTKQYNVYAYHLEEDRWDSLPPLQQYFGVPVNITDKLTIISGFDSATHKATNKVTTFSDNSWRNDMFPNLLIARVRPAVVPHQSYIIVAGGEDDDDTVLDTIEVLDINTLQWRIVNTHLPQPMYVPSATMCGESLVIVGFTNTDDLCDNETFLIDINEIISKQQLTTSTGEDNKWSRLADAPYFKTTLIPNSSPPVIIGGSKQDKTTNDITLYDDVTKSWRRVSSIPTNCAYPTVTIINNVIIVAGGVVNPKTKETANATSLTSVVMGHLEEIN